MRRCWPARCRRHRASAPRRGPPARRWPGWPIGCDWEAQASVDWFERSDDDIGARSLQTVTRVFPELAGRVDFIHVTRWRQALPYTRVGAYQLIGDFNASLDPAARLQFAGDYLSEAGQNTAVEFGNRAAANLLRHEPDPG